MKFINELIDCGSGEAIRTHNGICSSLNLAVDMMESP
jgi:hypothetical protein